MLPGYLWQMPLSQGCSLQPIHGCCGIRLPCRFWPTLPKPLRSSIVPPLPINQARLPNLAYKNGHFDSHSWDFWNGLKSTPAPLFLSTLRLPLSISALSCIPHSLRFSLPLPFSLSLCLAVIGLIFFFFFKPSAEEPVGKHQAIFVGCWAWTRLDLGSSVWVYLLTPVLPAPKHGINESFRFVVSDPWMPLG